MGSIDMEFLIYNTVHPLHRLTQEQDDRGKSAHKDWEARKAGQYIRGDIIEVQPDGFFTGLKARGYDKRVFRIVCVPGAKCDKSFRQATGTAKSRFNISTGESNDVTIKNSMDELSILDKGI